ncbi:MAG: glycerophosphodiester phosphodiesterase family protein [Subdoligranulum sp.]
MLTAVCNKKDKTVPENSLAAFERASSYGYGMELDVQPKDGQVVVFHDDTLNRVCGVLAISWAVDEKTYDELSATSLRGTTQTHPPLRRFRNRQRQRSAPSPEAGKFAAKRSEASGSRPMPCWKNTLANTALRALTPLSSAGSRKMPLEVGQEASLQIPRRIITARSALDNGASSSATAC